MHAGEKGRTTSRLEIKKFEEEVSNFGEREIRERGEEGERERERKRARER